MATAISCLEEHGRGRRTIAGRPSASTKRIYYPALITDANTLGFSIGATVTNTWPAGIEAYQFVGYEQTEINVRYRSEVLNISDPFALGISYQGYKLGDVISELRDELPQDSPWLERTWSAEVGAKRNFGPQLVTGAIRHYAVSRVDYIPNDKNEDYTRNTVVNMAAWYVPMEALKSTCAGNHQQCIRF